MKERERIISVDAVRKVLLDMGLPQVSYLTDEEIGLASLLVDLGLQDYELPEFLDRLEKVKYVYLDKDVILDFLHRGYSITVYELGEFSSKHFSKVNSFA